VCYGEDPQQLREAPPPSEAVERYRARVSWSAIFGPRTITSGWTDFRGSGHAFVGGSALSVSPVFSATTVTLALVVAAVVGILAGIGPAVQAASVEPTMALRYE